MFNAFNQSPELPNWRTAEKDLCHLETKKGMVGRHQKKSGRCRMKKWTVPKPWLDLCEAISGLHPLNGWLEDVVVALVPGCIVKQALERTTSGCCMCRRSLPGSQAARPWEAHLRRLSTWARYH